MQTVPQPWRIFRYIQYAFLFLSFVWMPTVSFAQTEFDFSEPALAQHILDREKTFVDEPARTDPSVLLREHEQILLAEPWQAKEICIPIECEAIEIPPCVPESRCNYVFVYPPQRKFCPNPLTDEKIILPPLPYVLTPFGKPPKEKTASIIQTPSKKNQPSEKEIAKKAEAETQSLQKQEPDMVALSPFLKWVKENNEKAAEIARENAKKYKKEVVIDTKDEVSADLFLNIRFPYKGQETANHSNNTSIYSTPEK